MGMQRLLSPLGLNRQSATLENPSATLEEKGVVKVSGFLSPQSAAALCEIVDGSYAEIRNAIETDRTSFGPAFLNQFETWNALWCPELLSTLQRINPPLFARVTAINAEIRVAQERLFGSKWTLCQDRVYFRKHRTRATLIAWHIDADAAGMTGYGSDSINIWLPLQDVGSSAPSIEFITGSHLYMKSIPLLPSAQATRTDDWANEHFPNAGWTPHASLGDAIIFSQWTLHRTQTKNTTGFERTSCEYRFVTRNTRNVRQTLVRAADWCAARFRSTAGSRPI